MRIARSLDRLYRIIGLRPPSESVKLLSRISKRILVTVLVENEEQYAAVEGFIERLSVIPRDCLDVRVLRIRLRGDMPQPCMVVSRGERVFAYCGDLDEVLFPIVIEAILSMCGIVKPKCPGVRDDLKATLYVVRGIPCIITGFALAQYMACIRRGRVYVVNASSLNEKAGRPVVTRVPLLSMDDGFFHEGIIKSIDELHNILRG